MLHLPASTPAPPSAKELAVYRNSEDNSGARRIRKATAEEAEAAQTATARYHEYVAAVGIYLGAIPKVHCSHLDIWMDCWKAWMEIDQKGDGSPRRVVTPEYYEEVRAVTGDFLCPMKPRQD